MKVKYYNLARWYDHLQGEIFNELAAGLVVSTLQESDSTSKATSKVTSKASSSLTSATVYEGTKPESQRFFLKRLKWRVQKKKEGHET